MPAEPPQDALLEAPSSETLAEIQTVVSKALNGTRVLIAQDSLTRRSALIIDPPDLSGRMITRPDHFDLKLSGSRCFLVHRQTGQNYPLKTAQCRSAVP